VLELDPHNLVALRSLGDIARSAGRPTEALQYFEELSHQEPNNVEIESIITALKEAPPEAEAAPIEAEAGETSIEAGVTEEMPDAGRSFTETSFTETSFAETPVEETATPSFTSGFEEFQAPGEPAEEQFPAPAEAQDTYDSFTSTELPEALLAPDIGEPDLSDLVAPDIDLDWGNGEPTQEALPGDLAEYATFAATIEIEQANEPIEEEVPTFDFTDLNVAEQPPAEQPVAAELPNTELPDAESLNADEEPFEVEPAAPVLTETMATLYRDQGLYDQAADVYRSLLRDRPYDRDLQGKLAEVESLAAPEAPPPFEGFVDLEPEPLPFVGTAPEAGEDRIVPDEEVESPWMSNAPASASLATPYAWAETQTSESEAGPAISDYFRSLLSWRPAQKTNGAAGAAPPEPEPEVSSFELAPDAPDQGVILDLTAEMRTPPAIPADSVLPWEEPVSPSMPVAPVTPPPIPPRSAPRTSTSDNPVEAAFEEWFSGSPETESTPASPSTSAQGPPPLLPLSSEGGGEDDDDLEMFRSWLQSLKK
jgi:hypothetical protein